MSPVATGSTSASAKSATIAGVTQTVKPASLPAEPPTSRPLSAPPATPVVAAVSAQVARALKRGVERILDEILDRMTKPELRAVAVDRGYNIGGGGHRILVERFKAAQDADKQLTGITHINAGETADTTKPSVAPGAPLV